MSVDHKLWRCVTEVSKAIDNVVMVGMKAQGALMIDDELKLFQQGLLGSNKDWNNDKVLCLQEMHSLCFGY